VEPRLAFLPAVLGILVGVPDPWAVQSNPPAAKRISVIARVFMDLRASPKELEAAPGFEPGIRDLQSD